MLRKFDVMFALTIFATI